MLRQVLDGKEANRQSSSGENEGTHGEPVVPSPCAAGGLPAQVQLVFIIRDGAHHGLRAGFSEHPG